MKKIKFILKSLLEKLQQVRDYRAYSFEIEDPDENLRWGCDPILSDHELDQAVAIRLKKIKELKRNFFVQSYLKIA